ncbi:S-layer homology domain-containing protein [Paenibacillus sp. LHD-117]|uniref:S-layer homology domain-containing protein n=1 Tax=Paenibacillus sp. LHD-117 TaxID=3071412 RepID=UPI0027DF951F|nr:S-layer homology domain-containing protein [Paenibacillus sp. LHD-117]MDQ6422363.1 S-layer homology domain-containing protein [Paenibacillus sp. LHD-117]
MTKNTLWKKTAITATAVLMLASGATSAFAQSNDYDKGRDSDKGWSDHDKWDNDDDDNDDDDDDNDDEDDNDDKWDKDKGWGDDDDKYKVKWNFKDEEQLQWALEYIMRLAAKGVFTGYEDGTFKPDQHINRIETLTAAVRLMGLREQAESSAEMNTELNFKDADKLEKKYPWAVGYVSVALENDLFAETETEIKPGEKATRLWSTILLIKALKLEDEAKALNNTKLDFKDANQIPAGSVGYVKLALDKGIITGYKDKHGNMTFRPNQPVTRAELAALLDRTDGEMPDHDARAIQGTLKASANGSLTVVQSDNTELALAVDPSVFIFRDDKKATIADLKAGDKLFIRTYQNKVVFIEVTEKAPVTTAFTELGIVNTLNFNAQAKLATITVTRAESNNTTTTLIYNVDANVTVVGDVSLLKVGQLVEVKGENNIVKTITIK